MLKKQPSFFVRCCLHCTFYLTLRNGEKYGARLLQTSLLKPNFLFQSVAESSCVESLNNLVCHSQNGRILTCFEMYPTVWLCQNNCDWFWVRSNANKEKDKARRPLYNRPSPKALPMHHPKAFFWSKPKSYRPI